MGSASHHIDTSAARETTVSFLFCWYGEKGNASQTQEQQAELTVFLDSLQAATGVRHNDST